MSVALEVPISFDEFGWSELEHRARAEHLGLDGLVAEAASHYESELAAGRPATRAPRFRPVPGPQTRRLSIELGDECLSRLELEARLQGVALERVLEHAALLYLADLDRG